MSTAEQIIAEHAVRAWRADGRTWCWKCGEFPSRSAYAAHVVAALTNAGHLLLDPDDVQRLRLVIGFTDSSDVTRVPMQALLQRLDELDVAAARVAEGGDQP